MPTEYIRMPVCRKVLESRVRGTFTTCTYEQYYDGKLPKNENGELKCPECGGEIEWGVYACQ